ncbi:alpha/beta hydrolase [Devosia sediminis]|uniref:Prolyl oligopeptidase family serine peptidase n=1 Tax=Devosia sediminis TaxID=2798801 RepID=A0A934IZZ8_9HYPH|nr:prolyl oligopeptidase family serine peptidase [Devosia sediminis]MBJ3786235.1 prolyl oligopeptidase family serine peptidase [Devosia sediminis]
MTKLSGPMLPPANGQAPDSAVVLLHGYGSDGNDLIAMAPAFQPLLPGALFVSPHAPTPLGMGGFQWFPIDWSGDRLASRQTGVVGARPVIVDFLEDLWAQTGITPDRTLLVGFSQGAMMALHVGLSLPKEKTLMGVIGISGAFLPPEGFGSDTLAHPPVCLVHGDMDDVVDPNHSADANSLLTNSGFDVTYHISRGVGHGVAPDGMEAIASFIARLAK